jgi:hypothetical protein
MRHGPSDARILLVLALLGWGCGVWMVGGGLAMKRWAGIQQRSL